MWLRYTTGVSTLSQTFRHLSLLPYDDVERDAQRTLRGIDMSNRLSHRKTWDLQIGADQLIDSIRRAFIDNFWKADRWYLNESESSTEPGTGWIEVTIPGGRIPIEYLQGIRSLPVLKATFTQKYPS